MLADARHAVKQPLRVRVQGLREQLAHRCILDQLARIEHGHALTEARDHAEVVRHVEHRRAAGVDQFFDQVEDGRLGGRVEVGRRLVEQEQRGRAAERHGDQHTLCHAAAQLVRVTGGDALRVGQSHPAQQGEDLRLPFTPIETTWQGFGQLLADTQGGVERAQRVLRHEPQVVVPDALERLALRCEQVAPVEFDAAAAHTRVGREVAHDGEHQRGFAGAAFADDAIGLAGAHGQLQVADGVEPAAVVAIGDGQVTNCEYRWCHRSNEQ